jgi:hypothetical protein
MHCPFIFLWPFVVVVVLDVIHTSNSFLVATLTLHKNACSIFDIGGCCVGCGSFSSFAYFNSNIGMENSKDACIISSNFSLAR